MKILGQNQEFWMCLVENQNRKCFVMIIYFIKYYKVILRLLIELNFNDTEFKKHKSIK